MIKQGDHIYFAFRDGKTVLDTQNKPRMYKSKEQYERKYPFHNTEPAELVEYAPAVHGEWKSKIFEYAGYQVCRYYCSKCGKMSRFGDLKYCHHCGTKMDGGET